MNVQQLREALPVTNNTIYMNTGWAGPTPQTTLKRITETLEEEACLGPTSNNWLEIAHKIRDEAISLVAKQLNASTDEVTLTHSTREGLNAIIFGMNWKNDDEILICDLEHPALTTPASVLNERYGVTVNSVAIGATDTPSEVLEKVVSAITKKTKLVALSHIQYTCGLVMPIKEISEESHKMAVPVLVDGAQTLGQIKLDMKDLGCDYYAAPGQKWLMGPVATGVLYVRADHKTTTEPMFSSNKIYSKNYPDLPLSRLAMTSNNPSLIAGFAESISLTNAIGISTIEKRSLNLANLLRRNTLASHGVNLLSTDSIESSCGLVTIGLDNLVPDELVEILQNDFSVVARTVRGPDGVRFSTHYFNTEEEVEKLSAILENLANK
mgnify:FL=1